MNTQHDQINVYLEALKDPDHQTLLSKPIKTPDGVIFRTFINRDKLKDLVLYSLPRDPSYFKVITKKTLRKAIGDANFNKYFHE